MKYLFILFLLLWGQTVQAFCPFSYKLLETLKEESALMIYKSCAEEMNDDTAQAKLAEIYDNGRPGIVKNIEKALFYYQLSADNGNAASQARLAQLYMELDQGRDQRAILYGYLNSISPNKAYRPSFGEKQRKLENDFAGELMHPYVLLMLANEKPANKWYYPTEVKEAPAYAVKLFKNYKINEEKKKQLTREATKWKKRKLLEIAHQILSEKEYKDFMEILYPSTGQGDAFKRNQLLKAFQEKIELKKQQDAQSVKAFY